MCLSRNISATTMLLNILTVFQLLIYARVLTVANFASCDYFSYLSRYVWTNMLQYPLQWCWQFFSEAQQSDALNNEVSCLAGSRPHWNSWHMNFVLKQTLVFLLAVTSFSLLVTLSMVSSARSLFFSVYFWSCVLRWITTTFKVQDSQSHSLVILRKI